MILEHDQKFYSFAETITSLRKYKHFVWQINIVMSMSHFLVGELKKEMRVACTQVVRYISFDNLPLILLDLSYETNLGRNWAGPCRTRLFVHRPTRRSRNNNFSWE